MMKKTNKKIWLYSLISAFLVICTLGVYIYNNVPLRTRIYRTICKGNWNLAADGDTIFATGYCGIRKYLIEHGTSKLVAENESFLRHGIVGHGSAVCKDRVFVACRSFLPGPDKNDKASHEGELVILNKNNLDVVSEFALPSKMNDVVISDSIMLLSGINRFYLFNISQTDFPQKLYEHISDEYTEYQGSVIWKYEKKRYAAFTLFTKGIDIWDITNYKKPKFVKNIKLSDICAGNVHVQTLDIKEDYPYLYATLAPMPQVYFKKEDVRGVIQLNVTDIHSIKSKVYYIPKNDFWKPMPGDAHPKSIDIYKRNIYLSAATSGAVIFKITDNGLLEYKGLREISNSHDQIFPICTTESGWLVSGDWNWNMIHINKITDNK
mgnify:FL=1